MIGRRLYVDICKPIADVVLAALLLVAVSWLVIFIILVYIILFQYPVFFTQARIGKEGKAFRIIKFRTLKSNKEASLQQRKFWLGDFLRFTSLDELPQLINVFRGEMSLIGPRPLPVEYLSLFSAEQRLRHLVRPGITGWAQIHGRTSISWDEKFKLDIYYIRNVSLWLDLKIIMKTILLILSFRKDTSLEEPKFTGNNNA